MRRVLELANGGDTVALRMCLDRLIAPRRERLVEFALPAINSAQDVVTATNAIAAAVAAGQLSPGEAASMSALVANTGRAVELVEIEKRLAAVESYQITGASK